MMIQLQAGKGEAAPQLKKKLPNNSTEIQKITERWKYEDTQRQIRLTTLARDDHNDPALDRASSRITTTRKSKNGRASVPSFDVPVHNSFSEFPIQSLVLHHRAHCHIIGLTVGVVTLVSFILVIPLSKLPKFKRKYSPTLDLSSACLILGHIIYALADRTGVLYLVLVGRMINGIGLTGCFFLKRYCTDPCIVGVRRRTTCTSLLILAQTLGMVAGPIVGGFLARIPMKTALFNKNTLPGWFMAVVWSIYWLLTKVLFKDVTDTADQVRDSKYDARSQCAEGEGAEKQASFSNRYGLKRPDKTFLMLFLSSPTAQFA
ncbi:uncharacterized MFS-type transporter C330.07c [Selaginella moellendorffii]|uniref:uncharacterized MFS-type transporter C330.07c n=1 Tax=Selaginella moellendorffii TaxID=88036 RepID=UPI000D1CDBBE|nr:uncharacterized MFS-type transporter C330.07c [Selaginella moellendorffii]|eukprot:XP_024533708.1 uncharacterized MFS-type transporter C330.07c [Selaginella moellendorffii]